MTVKATQAVSHSADIANNNWFKHILLLQNYKITLLTQIYKYFKQWMRTKDDNLIEFFSRYIQVSL